MDKHSFKITISGNEKEAAEKAEALATLGAYLDATTLKKLAQVVRTDPGKVAMAKKFLGV